MLLLPGMKKMLQGGREGGVRRREGG